MQRKHENDGTTPGTTPGTRTGVRPWVLLGASGLVVVAVTMIGYALRSEDPAQSERSATATATGSQIAGEASTASGPAAAAAARARLGAGQGDAASSAPGDDATGGDEGGTHSDRASASRALARGTEPGPGEPGRAEYLAAQRHARSVARDARGAASGGGDLSVADARALLAAPGAGSEAQIEAVDQLLDHGLEADPGAPVVADVVDSLRSAALSGNPEVAIAAAEALGEIETPASTQALGEILAAGVPEDVKLAAIDAITSLDAPGAAVALSRGLTDPNPDVRDEAAWGMSWVDDRDQSALAALVQAANSETDELIFDTMVSAIEDYE